MQIGLFCGLEGLGVLPCGISGIPGGLERKVQENCLQVTLAAE